jgi:Cu+-exporting ATPase
VVSALRHMGLACHIVTGDNWRTARIVAAQLGIINVQAEVLPAGKAEVVCTPCFLLILLLLFLL